MSKIPHTFLQEQHNDNSWKLFQIITEFTNGFDKLDTLGPAIAIFGSARFESQHPDYLLTKDIAKRFSDQGFHILSGGGPGIMEAANWGAKTGSSKSVGINIQLPHEQNSNPYQDISLNCRYFFTRKYMLIEYADAFIFMPGGFGTLDEVTEVLTLIQTQKMPPKPCIFVNTQFWKPFLDWLSNTLVPYRTIEHEDIFIYDIADTADEVMALFNRKK